MTTKLFVALAVTLAAVGAVAHAQSQPDADAAALRAIIQQTEKAINADDPAAILAHYSKDIVVSYPGRPDTTYAGFEKSYRQMLDGSLVTKTRAQVEEILVSGDLAIVRMMWHTTITEKATSKTSSRQARDLQVWRRENGAWKFFRGMWHHVQP